MLARLRAWALALKRNIALLWLAARSPKVPLAAKLVAGVVAAYALSPIDLIPDFIPVLGLIDDLLLLPAGIWLAIRLIPAPLLAELSAIIDHAGKAAPSRAAAIMIIAIWIGAIALGLTWYLG